MVKVNLSALNSNSQEGNTIQKKKEKQGFSAANENIKGISGVQEEEVGEGNGVKISLSDIVGRKKEKKDNENKIEIKQEIPDNIPEKQEEIQPTFSIIDKGLSSISGEIRKGDLNIIKESDKKSKEEDFKNKEIDLNQKKLSQKDNVNISLTTKNLAKNGKDEKKEEISGNIANIGLPVNEENFNFSIEGKEEDKEEIFPNYNFDDEKKTKKIMETKNDMKIKKIVRKRKKFKFKFKFVAFGLFLISSFFIVGFLAFYYNTKETNNYMKGDVNNTSLNQENIKNMDNKNNNINNEIDSQKKNVDLKKEIEEKQKLKDLIRGKILNKD